MTRAGERLSREAVNDVDTANQQSKNAARRKCHAGNVTPVGVQQLSTMIYAQHTVRVFGSIGIDCAGLSGGVGA